MSGKDERLACLAMDLGAVEWLVRHRQMVARREGVRIEGRVVTVDGDPGAQVRALRQMDAEAVAPAPIPKSRAGVLRVYGEFAWTPGRGRLIDIDDDWEVRNIRHFTLHTGQRRRLHRLVGAEFVALFREACEVSGYTPKSVQTFNPRRFKDDPDSPLSMHSWGIAVDFDPVLNRWGGKDKAGNPCPLALHPAFLDVFRRAGWTCGADWKTGGGDWMHIERHAPR